MTAFLLSQLSYHVCSLATEADPDTRAKVHDIRKYTAPCSLQQDMLVVDLTKFSIGILQGYLVPLYAD